jgi:prepilin-type N-terminal cleavage/methylation domain-containing protein
MFKFKLIEDGQGFTLTELLIAIFLGSFVILATSSVDLTARRFLISARNQASAQNEARFAMEHMVRNIREGEAVVAIAGDKVRVRLPGGAPPPQIMYRKTNSTIEFNPDWPSGSWEVIATGVVDNPEGIPYFFEPSAGLLTITITAQDGDEKITLTSTASLRNS